MSETAPFQLAWLTKNDYPTPDLQAHGALIKSPKPSHGQQEIHHRLKNL